MALIAQIDNFANMEDNGLYYVEGMSEKKINGKSVLMPTYYNYFVLDNTTNPAGSQGDFTGYYNPFMGLTNIQFNKAGYVIAIDNIGGLFSFHSLFRSDDLGKIHNIATTTSSTPDSISCINSDVFTTKDQNLLYPGSYGLGYGTRGQCKTTSTTTIIDKDGRDFTTLGIGTSVWNNKVYNTETGEEFTITSITTTDSTNDTLNFSAGTATNTANDYFVAFADVGKPNGGAGWDFFSTTSYPHFAGQEAYSSFVRQIKQFDTDYIIGNGNFLAALNEDETTWNDNFKGLPTNTQFRCMDVNQDRVLVGGDKGGNGVIMLWDGYSDGWLRITDIPAIPLAITSYGTGWVVAIAEDFYYTDGYSLKKITNIPDRDTIGSTSGVVYNGLIDYGESFMVAVDGSLSKRDKCGIYIYEPGKGWSLSPFVSRNNKKQLEGVTMGAIKTLNYSGILRIISSGVATGTYSGTINQLFDSGSSGSCIIYVSFGKMINVTGVDIKFLNNSAYMISSVTDVTVDLSISDSKCSLWRITSASTGSTTTSIVNVNAGSINGYAGKVGQQVRVLARDMAGERTYIQSIANPASATETWTISPALTGSPDDGTTLNMIDLRHIGSKELNALELKENYKWDVKGVYTDGMFLEVSFADVSTIGIERIDIYGE
jgi:hypothetical protein